MNQSSNLKSAENNPSDSNQPIGLVSRAVTSTISGLAIVAGIIGMFIFLRNANSTPLPPPGEEAVKIVVPSANVAERAPTPIPSNSITAGLSQQTIANAKHPLEPLVAMAKHGSDFISSNVRDYTAVLIKRLRVDGKLQPEEKMLLKIRHEREHKDPAKNVSFGIYTRFLTPKKGQEAIWVKGQNDDKIVAHRQLGMLNLASVKLDPHSSLAMNGNRYPIWSAGMLSLINIMGEQAERDLQFPDCKVEIHRDVLLNEIKCTQLVVLHEQEQEHFDFHRAEIFIDDERNLPVGFRSYRWPEKPSGKLPLEELYFYTDIKINVGLTDKDFDPKNEDYDFPQIGL